MVRTIDINADLGEGAGNDQHIMPLISSCNIACGGHFGNEESMLKALELARLSNVRVGAHPSFPDRDHFGRRIMVMSKEELTDTIFQQILRFMVLCQEEGMKMHHIKLHGALYNYAARDAVTSDAVIGALERLTIKTILYCPYGSVLHFKAENLFPLKFEGFIDRLYETDGSLASRNKEGAVITEKEAAWRQLRLMVEENKVMSAGGQLIPLVADTFCIHGDQPEAVPLLEFINEQMRIHNYLRDK